MPIPHVLAIRSWTCVIPATRSEKGGSRPICLGKEPRAAFRSRGEMERGDVESLDRSNVVIVPHRRMGSTNHHAAAELAGRAHS